MRRDAQSRWLQWPRDFRSPWQPKYRAIAVRGTMRAHLNLVYSLHPFVMAREEVWPGVIHRPDPPCVHSRSTFSDAACHTEPDVTNDGPCPLRRTRTVHHIHVHPSRRLYRVRHHSFEKKKPAAWPALFISYSSTVPRGTPTAAHPGPADDVFTPCTVPDECRPK